MQILKDSKSGDIINAPCGGTCKGTTRHLVITDIYANGSQEMGPEEPDYRWIHEYQIIQCQGCQHIEFREESSNSEDMIQTGPNEYEPDFEVNLYPNPEEGRKPVSDVYILPSNIQRIYSETLKALNGGLAVLTGIGIRAIVETACKDKNAQGNDLFAKINDLVSQGVLTKDGANILHKLRTLGNDAAHEVKPHDNRQLGLAMDVIDHLLQGVYILPHHAQLTFK